MNLSVGSVENRPLAKRMIKILDVGLNSILFIQISPTKHVHVTFTEDLNVSILLIEFISSCK